MTTSFSCPPAAPRYRLRFLMQEFDLPQGDTTIGRGENCSITIFDPLVSRRHVMIRVTDDQVVLEDLSSRNGMRVNGQVVQGVHVLQDGDRIRLGKNELVFKEVVPDEAGVARRTGSLIYCADCEGVYPQEAGACPHCGSSEFMTEITRSGVYDDSTLKSWALDMLVDLLNKTMLEGSKEEAARILQHAMSTFDDRLAKNNTVDTKQLQVLGEAAIKLSQLERNTGWAQWAERAYSRANLVPPQSVADALTQLRISPHSHDNDRGEDPYTFGDSEAPTEDRGPVPSDDR